MWLFLNCFMITFSLMCRRQLSVSLSPSVLVCFPQLLSASLSFSVYNLFPPPWVPLMGFSVPASPLLFLSFSLPLLLSCQLSSPPIPRPLFCTSAFISTLPPPSYLSSPPTLDPLFTPIALWVSPFLRISFSSPALFPPWVFFCVTWVFCPKTQWHLLHCPFILPLCWSQERMCSLKRLLWFLSKPAKGTG